MPHHHFLTLKKTIMAQVYAIIYDKEGNFIIGKKNDRGYFFHAKTGPGGDIVPGGQPLNGRNNWALPGGGLEVSDVVAGAIKELQEETGLAVTPDSVDIGYYAGPGDEYFGVFFNAGVNIQMMLDLAAKNLLQGAAAAKAVISKKYVKGQYDALLTAFPGCPDDNELAQVFLWNIVTNSKEIAALANSKVTSWYYNILVYLSQCLFSVAVLDLEGNIIGGGNELEIHPGNMYNIPKLFYDPSRLLQEGEYSIVTAKQRFTRVQVQSLSDQGEEAFFVGQD